MRETYGRRNKLAKNAMKSAKQGKGSEERGNATEAQWKKEKKEERVLICKYTEGMEWLCRKSMQKHDDYHVSQHFVLAAC